VSPALSVPTAAVSPMWWMPSAGCWGKLQPKLSVAVKWPTLFLMAQRSAKLWGWPRSHLRWLTVRMLSRQSVMKSPLLVGFIAMESPSISSMAPVVVSAISAISSWTPESGVHRTLSWSRVRLTCFSLPSPRIGAKSLKKRLGSPSRRRRKKKRFGSWNTLKETFCVFPMF